MYMTAIIIVTAQENSICARVCPKPKRKVKIVVGSMKVWDTEVTSAQTDVLKCRKPKLKWHEKITRQRHTEMCTFFSFKKHYSGEINLSQHLIIPLNRMYPPLKWLSINLCCAAADIANPRYNCTKLKYSNSQRLSSDPFNNLEGVSSSNLSRPYPVQLLKWYLLVDELIVKWLKSTSSITLYHYDPTAPKNKSNMCAYSFISLSLRDARGY